MRVSSRLIVLMAVPVVAACSGPLFAADLLPAKTSIENAIDHYITARHRAEKITAAPQADESTLLRRLLLDLIGRIPATVEVREFRAGNASRKRQLLVDRLLQSGEYVEHQSVMFDTFMANGNAGIGSYLKTAFKENRRWDRVFRDVMLGNPKDKSANAAAGFLVSRAKDIDRLTNDVSVVFFGINVSCAKCHDHPLVDSWKQDHFYGMKSFFARTFAAGKYLGERDYGEVSFKTTKGESRNAKLMFLTGTVVKEPKSKPLSAGERRKRDAALKRLIRQKKRPPLPKNSRRQRLVEVALKPGENGFFARAIVNRIWHQYMGFGLVMPLDQMHAANPPSHPELMKWLERDFVAHKYDLKRLVRGIVLSKAYSRSSVWASNARPDRGLFAVGEVKPLTPRQLARSLSLATTDPESFDDAKLKPADRERRIAQSANASNANVFEQPGENFQISADEALFFSNNKDVQNRYLNGGLVNRLVQLKDPREAAKLAVRAILCREATAAESRLLADYLSARKDRQKAARQQIVWSLLTGTEFRFNH